MDGKQRHSDLGAKAPSKTPQPLVAQPVRDTEELSDPQNFRTALVSVASKFPKLKKELLQSGMRFTPAGFAWWATVRALALTLLVLAFCVIFVKLSLTNLLILALVAPVFFAFIFITLMSVPRVKAKERAQKIDSELVFAGRHMLIELKSGVPLFDSLLGVSRDYGVVSEEFNKIVEKVTLGVPMGTAMHAVAENNPSQYFNRVVLQMANSIASGSDVATALEASLEQISKEQVIELKAYGQKLNPIAMFFMVFGIIMPSLGVAFLIVVLSFLGKNSLAISSTTLLEILAAIGLVQFMFLKVIENSRPKFDIGL